MHPFMRQHCLIGSKVQFHFDANNALKGFYKVYVYVHYQNVAVKKRG